MGLFITRSQYWLGEIKYMKDEIKSMLVRYMDSQQETMRQLARRPRVRSVDSRKDNVGV